MLLVRSGAYETRESIETGRMMKQGEEKSPKIMRALNTNYSFFMLVFYNYVMHSWWSLPALLSRQSGWACYLAWFLHIFDDFVTLLRFRNVPKDWILCELQGNQAKEITEGYLSSQKANNRCEWAWLCRWCQRKRHLRIQFQPVLACFSICPDDRARRPN